MKYKLLSKIRGVQDGAIYGDTLFRFTHSGLGCAYPMEQVLKPENPEEALAYTQFSLDKAEDIQKLLNEIDERHIFLSSDAKEVFAFWEK